MTLDDADQSVVAITTGGVYRITRADLRTIASRRLAAPSDSPYSRPVKAERLVNEHWRPCELLYLNERTVAAVRGAS